LNRRLSGVFFIFLFIFFSPGSSAAFQASGEASSIPWSGYWWPFKYGGLATGFDYRGSPAPLEKYHLLDSGRTSGAAIDWYEDNYYDPDAESWWGLCPAYARAAVSETYPILPASRDNIVFRVGDKKGLLTLCHDDQSGIIYASGATPVDFHRWLLDYIGDQKIAFTADMSLGREVWYHPIYRYEMDSRRSGQTEHVTVTIYYAADDVPPDYMGTEALEQTYTYDLFLDAQGSISGGEWTGTSLSNHPDRLAYPETTGPVNPYLDCEKIRAIAQAPDDFLEQPENLAPRLLPGTYHLVLLDADHYIVEGNPGDTANLVFTRQAGSAEAIAIEITDTSNDLVWEHALDAAQTSTTCHLVLENPPYTVSLVQEQYTDPNIYTLTMDFRSAHVRNVPYIPKNGPWSGFALTNAAESPAREIMVVTAGPDGRSMQTVLGPFDLEPHEKRLFHFSDLPVRDHEYADTEFLRLMSNQPLDLVNLFAGNEGPMASFTQKGPVGSRLVLPDLHDGSLGNPAFMRGTVLNQSFEAAGVTFHVFSAAGELTSTFDQTLAPSGRLVIRPGRSPFTNVPDGGWIEIVADPGSELSAYQYIQKTGANADTLETGFALPASAGRLIVPHVTPANGAWETILTLINPNPEANSLTIHPGRKGGDSTKDLNVRLAPFEKRSFDISTPFGGAPGLQRSILEISSAYPIAGHFTYAAAAGDTAVYPLLAETSLKEALIMPHAAYNKGSWWTGAGVCNPNSYPVTVFALPFNQNGAAMNSNAAFFDLEPGAYEIFTVRDKFPGLAADIAYIQFLADDPENAAIGGFYLYGDSPGATLSRKLLSGGSM